MPEIDHELKIDATPERVYAGLTTPDGLKNWHTPAASGTGEVGSATATFTLSGTDDDRTLLELQHAGWPGTHGNFRKCNTTWGVHLHHLRDYVETGAAAPAFD
jgi:uncharacterized protein YndB with AHSA1/START domain